MDLQAGILLARRALLPRPLQGHVQVRLESVLAESRRDTEGLALGTRWLRSDADAHATHSSTQGHIDSVPTRLPLSPREALRQAFTRPRLEALSCWSPSAPLRLLLIAVLRATNGRSGAVRETGSQHCRPPQGSRRETPNNLSRHKRASCRPIRCCRGHSRQTRAHSPIRTASRRLIQTQELPAIPANYCHPLGPRRAPQQKHIAAGLVLDTR